MAESKEFIAWVKQQAKKYPANSKITNANKLTSKYILSKYSTWGELYKSVDVVGFEKPVEEPKKPDVNSVRIKAIDKDLLKSKKSLSDVEGRIKNNKELLEQTRIDLQQYEVNSPMYNKAKERAKKLNADIKKYEAELKSAKEVIAKSVADKKALVEKVSAKDEAINAKEEAKALLEKAQRAEDAGDTAAAEKFRTQAENRTATTTKTDKKDSKSGTQFQLSDEENVANLLSSATVSMGPSGPIVQITEPNKIDPTTGKPSVYQGYLYLTTVDGGKDKAIFFGTSDVIRDRYQKQLIKQYGSKQAVIDKLYKAGYLKTNKEVPTSAYLGALDSAAGEYTVAQVNAYKAEGLKEFPTMNEFLAARKNTGGLGGTRTRTNVTEYDETDLTKIINAIYQDSMGRDANGKELSKLIPIVNKQLKKNPDVISTTTDSEGNVTNTKTKTGVNVEQFLIEEISGKDEAKAKQVLDYYNVFKQTLGVN